MAVITISRQFGAGAKELGKHIADKLEYYYADEEILERTAVEAHASPEWRKIIEMEPGGKLTIECPDFDAVVREYLTNEKRIDNIFGLQRFKGDTHLFGYNFTRLKELLEASGFTSIQRKEPQDYHKEQEPCMRVECINPPL